MGVSKNRKEKNWGKNKHLLNSDVSGMNNHIKFDIQLRGEMQNGHPVGEEAVRLTSITSVIPLICFITSKRDGRGFHFLIALFNFGSGSGTL